MNKSCMMFRNFMLFSLTVVDEPENPDGNMHQMRELEYWVKGMTGGLPSVRTCNLFLWPQDEQEHLTGRDIEIQALRSSLP